MSVHVLKSSQVLHATMDEAWRFFSDPRNLARISPPDLDLRVLTDLPESIYPGMMIEYRVRPILRIPVRWVTEITHVAPGQYFVDEQRIGPYRIWHHEHHFKDIGSRRIEVTDRVTYALPFGVLGNVAHPIIVKPQLDKIFAYRDKVVAELFS